MAALWRFSAAAQAPAADPSTLHVYVNRVQLPALVLNASHNPERPIDPKEFRIQLEGVGEIKPTRVRLEADDPIGFTLLVDRSDRDEELWKDLPKSLGPLLSVLQPQDRMTLFAIDGCRARRVGAELMPVREAELRSAAAEIATMKSYAEQRRETGPCSSPITYWDMVSYAAGRLAQFPGRRLLVTLASPNNLPDPQRLQTMHEALINFSVTMFPIVHNGTVNGVLRPYARAGQGLPGSPSVSPLGEVSLQSEQSGGMMIGTTFRDFSKSLARPVQLARGRYILEFPRPDLLVAGSRHVITVTDGHPRDFIRVSGISVPVAGPGEHSDVPVVDASMPRAGGTPAAPPMSGAAASASPESRMRERTADTPAAAVHPVAKSAPAAPLTLPSTAPLTLPSTAPPALRPAPFDPTDITGELHSSR